MKNPEAKKKKADNIKYGVFLKFVYLNLFFLANIAPAIFLLSNNSSKFWLFSFNSSTCRVTRKFSVFYE